MIRLIRHITYVLIGIAVVGAFTIFSSYIYVFCCIGFCGIFVSWLVKFFKNKKGTKIFNYNYLKIATQVLVVYLLIGVVFGLAIGTFPLKEFSPNSNSTDDIGFVDGIIISFSNLTTLAVTEYVPQNQFLKLISLFESVFSFFLFSLGIGLMINESTK